MTLQEAAAPGHLSATRQRDFAAFRLTPDLRFVFSQGAHEAAFAALLDALHRNEGMLLATGDVGVGKTMLARRIERELQRNGASVAYVAYPDLSIGELLQCLSVELDLGPGSESAAPDVAEAVRLLAKAPARRRVILLDDAEKCPAALLSDLQRLIHDAGGAGGTLQAVLFGRADLPARLSHEIPHIAIAAAAHMHLSPLSLDETATYIRHRLGVLGTRQDVFSADAIEAIASYARGVPRLINQACGRALLLAGPNREGAISQAMILEAIEDCPALALADARVAAWATTTSAEAVIASEPGAPVEETITLAKAAETTPIVAPRPQAEPVAEAAALIEADAASDQPVQLPEPPSARHSGRSSDPSHSDRQRKRRARPAPDQLRSSPPHRDGQPMTPPGRAPRFAGFIPRAGRSRPAPPVEGAGPVDAVLRRSAPPRRKPSGLLLAALATILALAASAGLYMAAERNFGRTTLDPLARMAETTMTGIRDAIAEIANRVVKRTDQP
jgi:type II secretory pathway predicted ATPase ExeA